MKIEDLATAISDLLYLRAMMTFDPNTGEELNIENDNKDNQSLYKSAEIAIQTLQSEFKRLENKPLTFDELEEMQGEFAYRSAKPRYERVKIRDLKERDQGYVSVEYENMKKADDYYLIDIEYNNLYRRNPQEEEEL